MDKDRCSERLLTLLAPEGLTEGQFTVKEQFEDREGRCPSAVRGLALAHLAWFCATAALLGCSDSERTTPTATEKPMSAAVASVLREDLVNALEIASEFRPFQEVDVHAKVAGYVKVIHVDIGDRVKQGQILAVLEVPELEQDRARARAAKRRAQEDIRRARSEIRRYQAIARQAQITYRRMASVNEQSPNLVAQQEIDVAQAQADAAAAELSAREAALSAAEEQLAEAQASGLWPVILYFLAILATVGAMLLVPYFAAQRRHGRERAEPFESGIVGAGDTHIRFAVHFYPVAIFFVIFDLEAIFIFAWAVSFRETGWLGYGEMLIFIGVLLAALVYLWRVGALDWRTHRQKLQDCVTRERPCAGL